MENFSDLTQQEPLALAITLDEEDSRSYSDLAKAMLEIYPGTARRSPRWRRRSDILAISAVAGQRRQSSPVDRVAGGCDMRLLRSHLKVGFGGRCSRSIAVASVAAVG
jgi:hypothetical protein